MATTTNYGWDTPDDTDLVKDGAAAIRTLGSSADTTVKNLSPGTTAGDLDYYTSSTAKARLGIGTAGQILKVNSGATAPEWAAATAAATSYTLINAGGTALTGATTVTVSSIGGYNDYFFLISGVSSANATATFTMRFNSDAGSNYVFAGYGLTADNTISAAGDSSGSSITLGSISTSEARVIQSYVNLSAGNSTSIRPFNSIGYQNVAGAVTQRQGYYKGSSTISTVSIISSSGNLDAGTIFVYGAN
jgi:hypothetical protein